MSINQLKAFVASLDYVTDVDEKNSSIRKREQLTMVASDVDQVYSFIEQYSAAKSMRCLVVRDIKAINFAEFFSPQLEERSVTFTDDQITYMAQRFLNWKLPYPFRPDNGVSFTPNAQWHADGRASPGWPIGTNLFGLKEAKEMVRFITEEPPVAESP